MLDVIEHGHRNPFHSTTPVSFSSNNKSALDSISQKLWIALCLYRLGRGDYLYTIAELASSELSMVCFIVNKVCQVLVDHLWSECMSSHTLKTFRKKKCWFWQFP